MMTLLDIRESTFFKLKRLRDVFRDLVTAFTSGHQQLTLAVFCVREYVIHLHECFKKSIKKYTPP